MVLYDTIQLLFSRYRSRIENLRIADVRLGVHLTAIRLSDDCLGVAATLADNQSFCHKNKRDFGDFTPTKITDATVTGLFESKKSSAIIDTLKVAVLNAISSSLPLDPIYRVLEDMDPIDLVDLQSQKTITIVGGFQSYIQKVVETGNRLFVLEMNENALSAEQKSFYVPANKYREVIPQSDIVIITGLTLVNNTIDGLLSAISPGTQVIVTGPSAGILPDILFENHVNIIGSTRITRPDLLFDIVSQGGAGYHLFKYCARKICILHE
ncbi:MAG: DUF364 domain-containing protein [Bacteroidota bacterium]